MKIAFDELFFLSFLVRWMSRQCATVAEADLLFVAESENHFDSFSPSTHVSESKAHCLRNAKQQQREKKTVGNNIAQAITRDSCKKKQHKKAEKELERETSRARLLERKSKSVVFVSVYVFDVSKRKSCVGSVRW